MLRGDLVFPELSNDVKKLDLALLEAELHPGFISLVFVNYNRLAWAYELRNNSVPWRDLRSNFMP